MARMEACFVKMHGCGNDFVVFDERARTLGFTPARAAALADRRTGIGCDQFITIERPPAGSNADAFMRIRNPDGAEAGACGNATRCVADLLFRESGRRIQVIRTVAGNLPAEVLADGRVTVDMGLARLDWRDVPLAGPADTLHLPLPGDPAALSMGNPHATFFVADAEAHAVQAEGPRFEHDSALPRARQYRLRPGSRPRPPPPPRLGARGRADARLRLRRLRGARQRASPRAHRPPRRR